MTEIWTTIDGRRVPIHELEDGHLSNCIRMLRRKAYIMAVVGHLFGPRSGSTAFTFYIDRLSEGLYTDVDVSERYPKIVPLVEEAGKRELPVVAEGITSEMKNQALYQALMVVRGAPRVSRRKRWRPSREKMEEIQRNIHVSG